MTWTKTRLYGTQIAKRCVMNIVNEQDQIKEVIKRLNYYEKGLQAGEKIEYEICWLCNSTDSCHSCIAYDVLDDRRTGCACSGGRDARLSVSTHKQECKYDKRTIRKWQTELKRRANANLKAAGSKWRIEWSR